MRNADKAEAVLRAFEAATGKTAAETRHIYSIGTDTLAAIYDGIAGPWGIVGELADKPRTPFEEDEAIEAMKDGQPVPALEDRDEAIAANDEAIEKEAGE